MISKMSRRIGLRPSKSSDRAWIVNIPAKISLTGKRQRQFFKNKGEAETFCQQQRQRVGNYGTAATILSPGQLEEAAAAFEILKPLKATLNEVVRQYLNWRKQSASSVPFKELFEIFLSAKSKHSKKYLTGLKHTHSRFSSLDEMNASEITPLDLENQMKRMTASVRNASLRNLKAVFNSGVKRGHLAENPIEKLDFAKISRKEVVTLTPKQSRALVESAAQDLGLLPYHVIGLFAGVRPNEMERLAWNDVDLTEKHIEVRAEVSKSRRRRIIDMEEPLVAWLNYYIQRGGSTQGDVVSKTNLRNRLRKIRSNASLNKWHQDVMRHTYASFWLAKNSDINRLTLYMGHETTAMLWKHYHKAVKKKEAEDYWNIKPPQKKNVIVPISAGSAAR
jgi:integrase